jgi:hypothetical protein
MVGVIGPTGVRRVAAAATLDPAALLAAAAAASAAASAGRLVAEAGYRLLVVPDRGVALAALAGYGHGGGVEALGLVPDSGVCEPAARADDGDRARRRRQLARRRALISR